MINAFFVGDEISENINKISLKRINDLLVSGRQP